MSVSRARRTRVCTTTLALLIAASAGCGAATNRSGPQVAETVTIPRKVSPEAGTLASAPNNNSPVVARVDLADFRVELEGRCAQREPQNTMDAHELQRVERDCIELARRAELDQAKKALALDSDSDPANAARFESFITNQASFVEDACWLTEEVLWVHWDLGIRDDGSLRWFRWTSCKRTSLIEETLLFHALASRDAKAFANHVDHLQSRGEDESRLLREQSANAHAFAARPIPKTPDPSMTPLDASVYVTRIGKIEASLPTMAKEMCETFPDLTAALGSLPTCERKLTRYYAALGDFAPDM